MDLDQIVTQAGGFGLFQIVFTIASTILLTQAAAHMGASIFVAMVPNTRCKSPYEDFLREKCPTDFQKYLVPDVDGKLSTCERYNFTRVEDAFLLFEASNFTSNCSTKVNVGGAILVQCTDWEFDRSVMRSTIVTDFNLVCGDQWAGFISQSSLMLGVGLGSIFVGYISDKVGRRHALLLSCVGSLVLGTALAFTDSFLSFTIVRALVGIFAYPPFIVLFVYLSEITVPRYRSVVAQALGIAFPFGFFYLDMAAYALREWRHILLVISIPFALGVLLWWFMPESPRWLYQKERNGEAEKSLLKVARFNRIKDKLVFHDAGDAPAFDSLTGSIETAIKLAPLEQTSFRSLFKKPNLRSATLIMFLNWFAVSCVYYGLTLNAAELDGDPFRNLCFTSLAEVVAIILTIPLANICGRRATGSTTGIMAGVMCILVTLVPKSGVLPVAILGKFAISISFSVMYIVANEIYPTVVRNLGIGLCSAVARLGGVASPLIAMLGILSKDLPYIVFGIIPVVSAVLLLALPETKGAVLPQTLQEGEEFVRRDRGILKLIMRSKRKASPSQDNFSEM